MSGITRHSLELTMNEYNPEENCPICGYTLGSEEQTIICIEPGELSIGSKSGQLCFFVTDAASVYAAYIHANCVLARMDLTPQTSLEYCACCDSPLEHEFLFRATLGIVEFDKFVPMEGEETILCQNCMYEELGEGDFETGQKILGLSQLK